MQWMWSSFSGWADLLPPVWATGRPARPSDTRHAAPTRHLRGQNQIAQHCLVIYAGFAFLTGIAGLTFAHAFFSHHFGNWGIGPWPGGSGSEWFAPMIMGFAWSTLLVRTGLALIAAWGLMERAQWGRIVAIVAAFLSLLKFPFGTAIGIWTLVVLLGYRNATLYEEI